MNEVVQSWALSRPKEYRPGRPNFVDDGRIVLVQGVASLQQGLHDAQGVAALNHGCTQGAAALQHGVDLRHGPRGAGRRVSVLSLVSWKSEHDTRRLSAYFQLHNAYLVPVSYTHVTLPTIYSV